MEVPVHLTDFTKLPLSSNQKRLWIIAQQDKNNPAYNIVLSYHLEGEIDFNIYSRSLQLLFDKQHTVFSVFDQEEDYPYLKIIPRTVEVDYIDFSVKPSSSRRRDIQDFIIKNSRICFDIKKGPLYRLYLLKEDNGSYFSFSVIHHLIFDGFSRRIFVQELSKIYTDLGLGIDGPLAPLRYQSYDYAELEKTELSSENEKNMIDFWKDNLKDCPSELKFPYDYQRDNKPTGLGRIEPIEIPKDYTLKLRELSKESNSSLFNTLLSILGFLFKKYTGENDICIGVPVSNRRSLPSFKIFGLFVNTIAVRILVEGRRNFREHIGYVTDITKKAILHSKLPFDKIVETVNPKRIPGLNPFFQISFSWLNNFTLPMDLAGIYGKRVTMNQSVAPFAITFYMWENEGRIEGEIEYDIDLLKRETIIRLRDNFIRLIGSLVKDPDQILSDISIISEQDLKMINSINNTVTNYPKDRTIAQLFEEQVVKFPDKAAVVYKDDNITYKNLNEKANQLARALVESGSGRNVPVGIMADKSIDIITGILGILKAGGGYVPISPDFPEERINHIVQDSGCKILLKQEKFNEIAVSGLLSLCLDAVTYGRYNKSNLELLNTSSDLAYIMYTSGSTGIPKGIPIQQKGVIRLVRETNYIDFSAEDKVLQSNSFVFDASASEIWGSLLNGGTLYIVDKEIILEPDKLGDFLVNNNITYVDLTSSLFTQIAELRPDIFSTVKKMIIGGDVLSVSHINKVRRHNPELTMINAYGPTENSCTSTAFIIDREFKQSIPIGRPISNSTAYIFDSDMNYQPIGVIGELYLGGDGLTTGYLNKPELNSKYFVNHPYKSGERLFRTGDMAKWLPDWNIEFHGRSDNQLKIRGFRVELGEIESVLSQMEGVVESVIKAVKIEEGDYKLVAFLNVPEHFDRNTSRILTYLRTKLPSYMIPSAFIYLNGFPKTINGKTDRNALSFDTCELRKPKYEDLIEISQTGKTIHRIWCETLKSNDLTFLDNFFDIGGNSLLAIHLANRISKEFNLAFNTLMVFEFPTIKDQSEFIEGKKEDKYHSKNIEILKKIKSKKNVNFKKFR